MRHGSSYQVRHHHDGYWHHVYRDGDGAVHLDHVRWHVIEIDGIERDTWIWARDSADALDRWLIQHDAPDGADLSGYITARPAEGMVRYGDLAVIETAHA